MCRYNNNILVDLLHNVEKKNEIVLGVVLNKWSWLYAVGFPIRIGIVGGRISNTIQSNIRIVRIFQIFRISDQFHVKIAIFT